jgi:molybdopterin synthase catalytic subunit
MNVRVRLFAVLRERAGSDAIELELADGATVADALKALQENGPLAGLLARLPVQMAVNREYAGAQTPLARDDELALIPPVSGGSQGRARAADPTPVHVLISETPLSIDALAARVSRPGAGALVIFAGVTRDVELLHYEAYTEMAEAKIAGIARACLERHGLQAIAIEHRVGEVALGEPSVIVAASAAHREHAFGGAREAIDELKELVPIWKREVDSGHSSGWVEGVQPQPAPLAGVRTRDAQAPARDAAP